MLPMFSVDNLSDEKHLSVGNRPEFPDQLVLVSVSVALRVLLLSLQPFLADEEVSAA
jgi:hypothetical protein